MQLENTVKNSHLRRVNKLILYKKNKAKFNTHKRRPSIIHIIHGTCRTKHTYVQLWRLVSSSASS